jgi:E3 ubiquitin-protein ligase RNF14
MAGQMDDSDDQRDIELSSLLAIFPEIRRVDEDDAYTICLDVPVNPSNSVAVSFPAAITNGSVPPVNGSAPAGFAIAPIQGPDPNNNPETHYLSYLPSVRLRISLPPKYPTEEPPSISISTSPPWLPADVVTRLEDDGPRLWDEMGRDIVVFTYIDHVQQSAEDVFGLVNDKGGLEVDPQHKIAILDYDIKAKRAAFEKETFDCGVCLDPKKGSVCHKMLDCGHVFCVECLQDFYNNAIKEGDLATVRCLAPNCAKDREKKAALEKKSRGKKIRTFISPSELLQIPLDQEVVKRYVTLKYKTELESDKNTIYCPRSWCNGAARSKKRKKPEGLELAEASDDDDEEGDDDGASSGSTAKPKPYQAAEELLSICEDCGFAFCSRCFQSWHGEFVHCFPRNRDGELTAEDAASLEYLRMHTTPCPTCAAPVQKTMGCNHMLCYRCQSHFCYLCSAWLDPANPYRHFNELPDGKKTSCYQRLWELEEGDGDQVDFGFARRLQEHDDEEEGEEEERVEARQDRVEHVVPVIEEPDDEEDDGEHIVFGQWPRDENNGGAANGDHQQVGVAREGPLVLRIAGAGNQPAGAGRGGPRGGAAPAAPARGGGLRGRQGAGARGGARRRVAGAGAGGQGRGAGAVVRAGAPLPRQNNRGGGVGNGGHGAAQRNNAAARAHGAVRVNGNHGPQRDLDAEDVEGGDLDAAQRAWVRHFVQLALNDQEDVLLDFDSDSD